mmetsp:Transcript_101641/g.217642  ORF Transcript_101641/g.217642 Transcript_101641/m.217642 type:complete len:234 (-) Transcript_101641:105-806(-)
MQAHEVLCKGGLVHSLVDRILLLRHGAEARVVDGIEARVQLQALVELAKSGGVLHEVEVPEPDGTVLLQLVHDLLALRGEIFHLLPGFQSVTELGGVDDKGGRLFDLRQIRDVDVVRLPDRRGAVRQDVREVRLLNRSVDGGHTQARPPRPARAAQPQGRSDGQHTSSRGQAASQRTRAGTASVSRRRHSNGNVGKAGAAAQRMARRPSRGDEGILRQQGERCRSKSAAACRR